MVLCLLCVSVWREDNRNWQLFLNEDQAINSQYDSRPIVAGGQIARIDGLHSVRFTLTYRMIRWHESDKTATTQENSVVSFH